MANVLIIDDDIVICEILCDLVARVGHQASFENTLKSGMARISSMNFDVVFLDVGMPDGNGLSAIQEIRATPAKPEVIIITGTGDPDGAEMAIKNGAWDYLQKPFTLNEITLPLTRVLQYRDNLESSMATAVALKREGIIGSSQQIHECLSLLAQASRNDANVLITGETGTGKELFARALHANSKRAQGNFVVVDCAALPESLKESALFGHTKGAFTGADRAAEGLVKQADGGTLFLDEVGELNPTLQKVFLRVLQEKRFRPVGGKTEIKSNFRLVAATNRNLEEMVKSGQFRSDILYRLKTISIELPALRKHAEDINEIVSYHIRRICNALDIDVKGCSPDFMNTLGRYKWPGNIRELVNTVEGAVSMAFDEPILFPKHLPDTIRVHVIRSSVDRKISLGKTDHQAYIVQKAPKNHSNNQAQPEFETVLTTKSLGSREEALEKADILYLKNLMQITRGNIKKSCEISGLGRTRLYTLLKKYNISRFGWAPDHRAEIS